MTTNRFLTIAASGLKSLVTAISASTGVSDANKIMATDASGKISSTFLPAGIVPPTDTAPASEALAAGDFINIWLNASVRSVRRANAASGIPAHGFVINAVTSGANATFYTEGQNTALTGLTAGAIYFLSGSTAGGASTTAPTAANAIVQELGYSLSATTIQFNRQDHILLT